MFRDGINRFVYWHIRMFLVVSFRTLYRLGVYGAENVPKKGAVLLLCNHQSYLDPLLCGTGVNRYIGYVARDTLYKSKLYRFLTVSVDILSIRRGETDITAMKSIISRLKGGSAVLLFPEATRSLDGKISAIKPGFGLLSRRGNAVVIPVVIDGAFECWPKHQSLPSLKKLAICYGKPISPEKIKEMGEEAFAGELTAILRRMQSELRIKTGKDPYDYADLDSKA